jgi:uncharacterized protein YdaU (DUF1376 family)
MKKIKQTYFSHDSNARNDIKLIRLRSKYGYEGYGIYFAIIELLFSEDNKLCINDFETLAFGLQCDSKKLEDIILNFDLFRFNENCFYSERLDNVINEIQSKSLKASESAKKRWNNANEEQTHSERNAIKLNKIKSNKTKSNKITLEQRIADFSKSVISQDIDMNKENRQAFIEYWTEPNKSGSKVRFEMEKTWHLGKRMTRWNNNNFGIKQKNRFPEYYNEFTWKQLDKSGQDEYAKHLKNLGFETIYSPTAGTVWRKKTKI